MPDPADDIIERGLQALPTALRADVQSRLHALETFLPHAPAMYPQCDWLQTILRVLAGSEFVAQTCLRHPEFVRELIDSEQLFRVDGDGELAQRVRARLNDVNDVAMLKQRLRHIRAYELVRLGFRDLAGWATLAEVMRALSELADTCIQESLGRLTHWAYARYGTPKDKHGQPIGLVVLALGKLGGYELNFSSDVDLMFAYNEDGETAQAQPSHEEFFTRLGQALIQTLSDPTEDGFVFRVDMRLRPNGASGPLTLSFDALEHYYQVHGREWERYALIKARVVAGDAAAGNELLARLRPFIYRRYLDYGAIDAIRAMKGLIAREVQRKGMDHNIKVGPGGIREIEFIAQALQLIRGGREPLLQERSTVKVLEHLAGTGHLVAETVRELLDAYIFLRRVEHRLQMVHDQQTHTLPLEPTEQARLAFSLEFSDWSALEAKLNHHRAHVRAQFSAMFAEKSTAAADETKFAGIWSDTIDEEKAQAILQAAGFDRPDDVIGLLEELRKGSTYRALSNEGRSRLDRLMPSVLAAAAVAAEPHTTLVRLIRLLESIGRRSAYFALLKENRAVLTQLVKLCSASPWIASWISQHPILLDDLVDPRELYAVPTQAEMESQLRARLLTISEDDLESQMEVLREFRNAHLLRVAAADIGPGLSAERVGLQLALIAEVVLEQCMRLAYRGLAARYGEPRPSDGAMSDLGFAIVAYGRLGSRELGYTSDLDIIFLYDSEAENGLTAGPRRIPNELFFARVGQRLIHILATRTSAGILYEVDMRLRPSGQAGALVTSLAAFESYQRNQAWTWEHQALVRARAVAGEQALCEAFETTRREILCLARDPDRLKKDVREMRDKMRAARHSPTAPGQFDIKHGPGGIVDIEFMVQYWVLRYAHDYPELANHTDNIAILQTLGDIGLLSVERTAELTSAYRHYLSVEHRMKLMERGSLVPLAELEGMPARVAGIWRQTLGEVT